MFFVQFTATARKNKKRARLPINGLLTLTCSNIRFPAPQYLIRGLFLSKSRNSFFAPHHPAALLLAAGIFTLAPLVSYAQNAPSPSIYGSNAASSYQPANPAISPGILPPARAQGGTSAGINIPAPPPASGISPDAAQLAHQAEIAAAQATPQLNATQLTPTQAEAAAKAEQAAREIQHNQESFDRASSGLMPLSPDQIRAFMRQLEATQKASQPPPSGPPKAEVRMTTLSLDPGVDPPQINLAAGYVTTITMIDSTGEPWPIMDVGVGGNFEVTPTQAGAQHVVRVMPLTREGTGNLSVLLKDLPTPVIFRLSAGGPTVDMRYDARIAKPGPTAKVPIIARQRLEAGGEAIMLMLDNIPPKDAKRMHVSGVDTRTMAWMYNEHVYVRTPLTLLSPAWDASVSSADGTTVYEIGDAPVLLMSDSGAMVRARLVRDDDHDK